MVTREDILNHIDKLGFPYRTYLREINLTPEEAFLLVHPEYRTIKCPWCPPSNQNSLEFITYVSGYKESCHEKECKKALRKDRTEKSNLLKYGVKNVSQLQSIKDQKRQTVFEHFGTYDYLNSENLNEK